MIGAQKLLLAPRTDRRWWCRIGGVRNLVTITLKYNQQTAAEVLAAPRGREATHAGHQSLVATYRHLPLSICCL